MFDAFPRVARSRYRLTFVKALAMLLAMLSLWSAPALAQADNPSGLPLPRFATTRSTPINVRVGPGTKYEVAWIYTKSGVPVEIVQEFDTWRKIRDQDGEEGWVHQNLLSGTRAGYVAPVVANGEIVLRAGMDDNAGVRARLGPGLRIQIKGCNGTWCEVSATGGEGQRTATYSGFLHQEEIWGVYPDEVFD
ncbi:MAG: hypothetical protein JWR39_1934 [Devosia sp.]|nr:hypothetical protein [Devosia sp.]